MKNPFAFPRPFSWDESPNSGVHSGDRPEYHQEQDGMTLRDYFAAAALNAVDAPDESCAGIARLAYSIADAMMAERLKPTT